LRASFSATVFVARASQPSAFLPGQDYAFTLDLEQACFFDAATGKAILCAGES
jgi:hypothetical protein